MINLKSLLILIAFFSFIVFVPLGLVRYGVDLWNYHHSSDAGAQRIFQDHHGLSLALIGVMISSVFALLAWRFKN